MKTGLFAACVCAMMSFTLPASAQPLQDTPENRAKVREGFTRILGLLKNKPQVETVDLCKLKLTYSDGTGEMVDLKLLDDVYAGRGFTGTETPKLTLTGGRSGSNLSCTLDTYGNLGSCDMWWTINGISEDQFRLAHQAAANVVAICNPQAKYQVCKSGIYRDYQCADSN